MMKVMYLMTRDVIVGRPDMPVDEAVQLMQRHHVSGLPVIDEEDRVLGVFSQTDALRANHGRIGDLMTAPAITVEETATMKEVAAIMSAKDVNRIPVVREGRLVGVISRADIVRYVATHHAWG